MSIMKRGCGILVLFIVLASLGACATPGPVLSESVGTIRVGIGTAREQARLALEGANRLAREQATERKVEDGNIQLAENDFPLAVAQADVDQWAAAFGALDSYAAALQQLIDPKLSQGTGDALQALGQQLQNGQAVHASLPSGVAGVFAAFGQALIQSRAEKKATDVMRSVTPAFNTVMSGMAAAIGADNTAELRGTVHTNWAAALARSRTSFSGIAPADLKARREVVQQFLETLNARDAQLANLDQLRTSLIALGEAHAAAGLGHSGEALFWIGRIDSWLDDVRRRTQQIEEAHQQVLKARNEAQAKGKEKQT